jgi:hypothetical protein
VAHQRRGPGNRCGGRSDLGIRHAEQDRVRFRTLAAPGGTSDVAPRCPQGFAQGRAKTATSNNGYTKFTHFAVRSSGGNGLIGNSIYPRG